MRGDVADMATVTVAPEGVNGEQVAVFPLQAERYGVDIFGAKGIAPLPYVESHDETSLGKATKPTPPPTLAIIRGPLVRGANVVYASPSARSSRPCGWRMTRSSPSGATRW